MAQKKKKKQTTNKTYTFTKQGILKALSFFGIVFAAVVFTIGAILNWCGLGNVTHALNLVAQIFLLVAVAIPAYDFIKYKNQTWQIVFWIALVIYVFGCVFGMIHFYVGK